MHFQRITDLEEEIEILKNKLVTCTRDNQNLQEELSEAYRIKSHLAELHRVEVTKSVEVEKQVKFFHGCMASAFAERDHSIMEAEKAKEKEELMTQKLHDVQKRLEALASDCLGQERKIDDLRINLAEKVEQNEILKQVVDRFYGIWQSNVEESENISWSDKCNCLLHEPEGMWSFNDSSTSNYISSLEEELRRLRSSLDNLHGKLQVGLEIEKHLRKRAHGLERKKIASDKVVCQSLAALGGFQSQLKNDIINLLDAERLDMKTTFDAIVEKFRQQEWRGQSLVPSDSEIELDKCECRDVHMDVPDLTCDADESKGDSSEALAQALNEKVEALLLLSQQEERHLLERNVNAALQRKIEELRRNLLQVTNEKVKALVELAQLKRDYELVQGLSKIQQDMSKVCRKGSDEAKHEILSTDTRGKGILAQERDGRLRNLLKKTYLRRWIGALDINKNESETYCMDFARLKIEYATLKETMESMEHLISASRRLRLSLLKVKESFSVDGTNASTREVLNEIVIEANLLKMALGSFLPVSWSSGEGAEYSGGERETDKIDEEVDPVSAAGFEMVELIILVAQILEEMTGSR